MPHRHCERSEAIQRCHPDALDCVAALAMTAERRMLRYRATVSTFAAGNDGTPNHRRPGRAPGPRFLSTAGRAGPRLKAGVTTDEAKSVASGSDGPLPANRATTAHPEPRTLSHPASVSTFATFAPVAAA